MTPGQQAIIESLRLDGFPVTRENYIEAAYGDDKPDPWTAEDEAELPDFLQIGFEGDGQDGREDT